MRIPLARGERRSAWASRGLVIPAILALGTTTTISRLAMFSALRQVGGVETSLGSLLELLVSLVLAFLLLGERLTSVQWVGGALLMASVALMARDPGMRLAGGNVPLEWKRE